MKRALAYIIASALVVTMGLSIYLASKELELLDDSEGEVTLTP